MSRPSASQIWTFQRTTCCPSTSAASSTRSAKQAPPIIAALSLKKC